MYEDEGFLSEGIHRVLRATYRLSNGKFGTIATAADIDKITPVDEETFQQVVRAAWESGHAQKVGGPNQLVLSQTGLRYAARITDSAESSTTFGDE